MHCFNVCVGAEGCVEEANFAYYGNTIGDIFKTANKQACADRCANHQECLFWSYQRSTGNCRLKNSKAGREKLIGYDSGNKECGSKQGKLLYIYCLLYTSDAADE